MRRFNINVGLIVVIVVLVVLEVSTIVWHNRVNAQNVAQYSQRISQLEATIAGYGSEVTCWTVNAPVKAGDEITEDRLQQLTMYSSLLTDQYVTDTSEILGQYFKIAVNPGTPIFYNSVMSEMMDDTLRDHDIVLDSVTVGVTEGDFIDIRMTMPYGDDYIVISHKRVYGVNDNTFKLYLTEQEWNTYIGAMLDYYLNKAYGCTIYGVRYVEPGLQQDAVAYYAVPTNIASLLQKNPNIVDKEAAANTNEWRTSIEELLVLFRDEDDTVDSDGSTIAGGRGELNSGIESDRKAAYDEYAQEQQMQEEQGTEEVGDDYWSDMPAEEEEVPAE